MKILNSTEFTQVVNTSEKLLVVDFFAEWCGPCKMLSPVLESLSADFGDKLDIVKVDIDESSEVAQQYGVTSVPTLVFIKGGQEVDRMVGFQSKDSLSAKFNSNL